MIKLKKILNENIERDIAYHVSEKDVRNSIKKYGLDPNKYKINDRTTAGDYIYVFLEYLESLWYINMYNSFLKRQNESTRLFDIWKVDTKGLKLIKDLTLNTGDDPLKDSAYIIKSPVNIERLKLIKTIS